MKSILFCTLLTVICLSGFSQECEVCKYVTRLKKEVYDLKHLVSSLQKELDAKNKQIEFKNKEIEHLKKTISDLSNKIKSFRDILKRLEKTVEEGGTKNKELIKEIEKLSIEIQNLKLNSIEQEKTILTFKKESESEKEGKEQLAIALASTENKLRIAVEQINKILGKNLPLDKDSTFMVPYNSNFAGIRYEGSSMGYRLNPDEYQIDFLNHLKWFLSREGPKNITVSVTIVGIRRHQDKIKERIIQHLTSYIDVNLRSNTTFETGDTSIIYFYFSKSLASPNGVSTSQH